RVFFVAAAWVTCELLRARGPTADPWLLLGYALVPYTTFLQAADLGGMLLLSFVVAVVNGAVAEMACSALDWDGGHGVRRRIASGAALAGICVPAAYGYGLWRLATPLSNAPAVPITVVQGNNDLGAQWREEYYGVGLQTYLDLSRAAAARLH